MGVDSVSYGGIDLAGVGAPVRQSLSLLWLMRQSDSRTTAYMIPVATTNTHLAFIYRDLVNSALAVIKTKPVILDSLDSLFFRSRFTTIYSWLPIESHLGLIGVSGSTLHLRLVVSS